MGGYGLSEAFSALDMPARRRQREAEELGLQQARQQVTGEAQANQQLQQWARQNNIPATVLNNPQIFKVYQQQQENTAWKAAGATANDPDSPLYPYRALFALPPGVAEQLAPTLAKRMGPEATRALQFKIDEHKAKMDEFKAHTNLYNRQAANVGVSSARTPINPKDLTLGPSGAVGVFTRGVGFQPTPGASLPSTGRGGLLVQASEVANRIYGSYPVRQSYDPKHPDVLTKMRVDPATGQPVSFEDVLARVLARMQASGGALPPTSGVRAGPSSAAPITLPSNIKKTSEAVAYFMSKGMTRDQAIAAVKAYDASQ